MWYCFFFHILFSLLIVFTESICNMSFGVLNVQIEEKNSLLPAINQSIIIMFLVSYMIQLRLFICFSLNRAFKCRETGLDPVFHQALKFFTHHSPRTSIISISLFIQAKHTHISIFIHVKLDASQPREQEKRECKSSCNG